VSPFVAIVVGSRSDLPTLEGAPKMLDELGIGHELRVISAHRAPAFLEDYVNDAERRGAAVFIAAAGLAAHLPGVIASKTLRPVIGVPLKGGIMDGLDALLSIVQMPRGVPVATVGVGNATNAALLAAQILALGDEPLRARLAAWRRDQAEGVRNDEANVDPGPA